MAAVAVATAATAVTAVTTVEATTGGRHAADLARRTVLLGGGAAAALVGLAGVAGVARAAPLGFPTRPGEQVLPWLDQPAANPVPEILGPQLQWEQLRSFITPENQFFTVAHYGQPTMNTGAWRLEVGGLVQRPLTLTLDELRARPRQEVVFTVECSGNTGLPFLQGAIGTGRWAGTPLAPLLAEAGVLGQGKEVVFWGADSGEETLGDAKVRQHFARSMSVADASDPNLLLCYEMNGQPLPAKHGAPLRLIAPGWYGIANVKWLTRIELRGTRLQNRFMAREYVTLREEPPALPGGEPVWTETSVGRALLKSAPAHVSRAPAAGGAAQYRIAGAAWGAQVGRVEVQIDGGPWLPATIDRSDPGDEGVFAWRLWTLDWPAPGAGEHTVTSRATATDGRIQPAMDDPWITGKRTFWESNGQITRRVAIPTG
jgi:DMSO/TMAO reductase YedYZ molybdopterin-dependent catalytic subunit